jgi:transglutaminase-like putative cysteine protease
MASVIRVIGCSTGCLLLSAAVLFAESPALSWKIETRDRQIIEARISYEVHTTTFIVNRWMAYMPEPPELPSQTNLKVSSTPKSKVMSERSPLARKVRQFDVAVPIPSATAKLQLELNVQATLRARKLVPIENGETPPKVVPLTQTEAKYYTSPGQTIDFKAKPFKTWLEKKDLHSKKGEQPIDFAERVLDVIRSDYEYGYSLSEKRASFCCDQTKNDCSGMTFVFVAAMRASGIPARALVGRLAKPRKIGVPPADREYDQPHVRAEFFLADVGWVAADPSNANSMKFKKVREFIGYDPGDMLVLHVDVDLKLPYPDQLQTAECLQVNPSYWAHGKGVFEAKSGDSGWYLKSTPIKKD